jgi:hypothetical protein
MPVRRVSVSTLYILGLCTLPWPGFAARGDEPPAAPAALAPAAPVTSPTPTPPSQALASAAAHAAGSAVELPSFQFGLWEFKRTLLRGDTGRQQVSTIKRCADPGADMREKMESLKSKGCQFTPLKHNDDHYVSSWVCKTPSGTMRFRDVLLVQDANGYQDISEMRTAQRVNQQKIEATRVGGCPGMGSGAPLTPTKPPARHP